MVTFVIRWNTVCKSGSGTSTIGGVPIVDGETINVRGTDYMRVGDTFYEDMAASRGLWQCSTTVMILVLLAGFTTGLVVG